MRKQDLAAAEPAAAEVVRVQAVRCPAGHLNPASQTTCRACASPIFPQEAMIVPRPSLGVLRLPSGDPVSLDRGVFIGRSPRIPEGWHGPRPNLLQVSSPGKDVSRTHAEIVLEGWHVLVRDLGSTNGTTLTLPGRNPMRIRDPEPVLVEPGTVIGLADEVFLRFEGTV
jgi:pSer/pThr/pTyr-binding forkhead associated (FHA) protein